MKPKKIGFLIFDDFTCMDLTGPLEVFASVSSVSEVFSYQTSIIGCEKRGYKADSGIQVMADQLLEDIDELDTLIIPGGAGSRNQDVVNTVIPWLLENRSRIKRIVSVCTGAFILASAGLLDGLDATSHWAYIDTLKQRFPKVRWAPDSLYIDNGSIATSAGIASGIDLSLKLVEKDLGSGVAMQVARFMVVHYRRNGNQAQFSEPLKFQVRYTEQFADLTAWILSNLNGDLSLESLAAQSGMSVRNFCRRFTERMELTPAKYVEHLRLDHARHMLSDQKWPISRVATASGYRNIDVFRRAFERRFEMTPKAYREQFSALN